MNTEEEEYNSLHWNDDKIYKWTIKTKRKNIIRRAYKTTLFIVIFLMMIEVSYLLLYLIGLASQLVAFWIAFTVTLIFIGLVFLAWLPYRTQSAGKNTSRMMVYAYSFLCLGSFAYVISSPVSFLHAGFIGNTDSGILPWIVLLVDAAFDVISFGITAIFSLRLSDIEPYTWVARFSVALFRLFVSLGLLQLVIFVYRTTHYSKSFYGTVKDCYSRCNDLLDAFIDDKAEILREGELKPLPYQQPINIQSYINNFKSEAESIDLD